MLDLTEIGKRIAQLRKELKMTQNELADTLFVTHQAVSKWENGKSIPSIEILFELTKLFKISIDYLLDNTEIKEDNYKLMFENYSRDVVVSKIIKDESIKDDIGNVFYLLNKTERLRVINSIINKLSCHTIHSIWPYLNNIERMYLLGNILSGKCDYNLMPIINQLTPQEQQLARKHYQDGSYKYKLPHINIRS